MLGGCFPRMWIPEVKGEWKGELVLVTLYSEGVGELKALAIKVESGPDAGEEPFFEFTRVRIKNPVLLSQYEESVPRWVPANGTERIGEAVAVKGLLRQLDLFVPESQRGPRGLTGIDAPGDPATQPTSRLAPREPDLVLVIDDKQLRKLRRD